ncbi:hypothetical protein GHT06_019488 [Daphnia sinensis]|uniref:BTB domain-containing protein n=1 Tax=Daphnia sinensis TaxID=1820382 RepID=A0AAD5L1E0_9CRUS|nr:hypothetical protein GHT06_019488 [Daphnia sinensis]
MSDEENLVDIYSSTRAVHYHIIHTWRIESYEQYFSSTKCHLTSIHSSVFGHEDDPGTKWTLQLFPKGDKEASNNGSPGSETLSFFINLDKSSDVLELPAKYSVAIIGDDRCAQKVTGDNTFKRGSGWGRSKFMKMEELLKDRDTFLVNDAMTIRCTVQYTKHVTSQERRKKRRNSSSSASTEPFKILNTDNLPPDSPESTQVAQSFPWHDVTFVLSGSYVRAHKWIVAASSPLLAQLVGGCESVIKVEGVDPESFTQMIRFIYTGDCDIANGGYKLMSLANKYKLQSLFIKCEEYFVSILDKSSCFMMYSLADMYSSPRLKTEALKVIESLEFIGDGNKFSMRGTVALV